MANNQSHPALPKQIESPSGGGVKAAMPTGKVLRRVPVVAGAAVAGVGVMVLVGWVFGFESLKSLLPGLATMKANTALCFLLAGAALALYERRAVRLACSGLVCAVAGLTLAEYITGGNFGLDEVLFRDSRDAHTIYPGRMVEATSLGLLLLSASLLLLKARSRTALWAQQALAVGAVTIGMVAILGYANDVQQFYRFAGYSSMALHTAASLVVLALGLFFARSDGLGALLTVPGPGAQITRRLLPVALLAPAVLGWLIEQGLKHGFYGESMDTALLSLVLTASFVAMVWWTARAANRTDASRRVIETQLRNQADLIDHAHEALIVREPGGVIRSWNRGAEGLYGWTAAEALGQRTHALLGTEGVDQAEMDAQLERTGRWEGELVHTSRDGRRVTVESRQTANRMGERQVFILQSDRDITERKQAEQALRQSRERLDLALVSSRMATFDWDILHDRRIWSEGVHALLGTKPESFAGTAEEFFQAIHAADRSTVKAALARAVELTGEYETEYRAVWPDHSIHYISARGKVHHDHAGRAVQMTGVCWDISVQKQAETEIRRRAEELRAANEELTRFNRVSVGRELRIIELKKQVNELCAKLGQPQRYAIEPNEVAQPTP